MLTIKCVILDDEPLARKGIERYIEKIPYLQLVGSFASPIELLKLDTTITYDLLFLDIEMPRIDGLTYLRTQTQPPLSIIITAYPQYALEGFELDVLDYLVKPVAFEKFMKATQKAYDYLELTTQKKDLSTSSYFFIKENKKLVKVFYDDILYIEALQNYIKIITTKKQYITYLTMKDIANYLNAKGFIRIHKSFIISIDKVTGIEGNLVIIGNKKLPLSKERKKEIIETIVGNHLWKRE